MKKVAAIRWTPTREAKDYDRWIAAVPNAKDRAMVRAWVDSCGTLGRRQGWECGVAHTDEETAAELVRFARAAKKAKPFTCGLRGCTRPPVARNEDTVLCAEHLSPFDAVEALS